MVSNCCTAQPLGEIYDTMGEHGGVCGSCKEHASFVPEDEDELQGMFTQSVRSAVHNFERQTLAKPGQRDEWRNNLISFIFDLNKSYTDELAEIA